MTTAARARKLSKQREPKIIVPQDTVAFWSGSFGNEYTARQTVDWRDRVPFWQGIIDSTHATSFLEIGVNCGYNLEAIRSLNPSFTMSGVDVNDAALVKAMVAGFDVENAVGSKVVDLFGVGSCELALTAGCLIHVAPEDLQITMAAIRDVSSQYVLAVEYAADVETEVEYRGHAGKLWKRPYGKLYEELGGLTLIETGQARGFDRCDYWILERAAR